MSKNNTNETPETPVVEETVKVPFFVKAKETVKRFALPIVALVAGGTAIAVIGHERRIDQLEGSNLPQLEEGTNDDYSHPVEWEVVEES